MTKLRHVNGPLKGEKKAAPAVDTHPYMVVKKYAKPTYHKSLKAASDAVRGDLQSLLTDAERLCHEDSCLFIRMLLKGLTGLTEAGGVISGVIDPHTQMRYGAEIVVRESIF